LGDIGRAVLNAAVSPPVTMDVSGYGLYKSVLRPTGAEYSLLHQAAFGSRG
jgi:hypothetical protein